MSADSARLTLPAVTSKPRVKFLEGLNGSRVEPLAEFFPRYLKGEEPKNISTALADPWFQKRLRTILAHLSPQNITVRSAPHNPVFLGKTLQEIGQMYDTQDITGAFSKLLKSTLGRAVLEVNSDENLLPRIPSSEAVLFGSLGSSELLSLPAFASRATEADDSLLQLVESLTARPAEAFGLAHRGRIIPGAFADLVIWTKSQVRDVFVNGTLTVREGNYLHTPSGRPLTSATPK